MLAVISILFRYCRLLNLVTRLVQTGVFQVLKALVDKCSSAILRLLDLLNYTHNHISAAAAPSSMVERVPGFQSFGKG